MGSIKKKGRILKTQTRLCQKERRAEKVGRRDKIVWEELLLREKLIKEERDAWWIYEEEKYERETRVGIEKRKAKIEIKGRRFKN